MYIFTDWDFKKNFEIDFFTGLMTKTSTTSGIWDARAYRKNVFDSLIEGAGFRVFHNDNPGEITDYAVGISNDPEPNNLNTPSQLQYGLHFHGGVVDVIDNGTIVHQQSSNNNEYRFEFQADGTCIVYEDEVTIFDCISVVDFSSSYSFLLFASIAENTDLETQIDLTGIKKKHILDVMYDDGYGSEISLYTNPYNLPINTQYLRVYTNSPVLRSSLNNDSVKLYRFIPANENVEEFKELQEIIVPYDWSTVNYFDIFVPNFEEGYVYELLIGTTDNKLISHTSWGQIINEIDTYSGMSDAEFVDFAYNNVLQRSPTPTEQSDGENTLAAGTTRETFIRILVNSIEYQSSPFFASEIPFESKFCVFKSFGEAPIPEEVDLSQFFNDVYYKARNLDALVDVDKIIFDIAKMFNYTYKVSEYDADLNKYYYVPDQEKIDANLDDVDTTLTFDNAKIIEELFVKQYLPEYKRYVNDINNPNISILNNKNKEKMKDLLFKNITLMNYFKGNKGQMQHLISIFSESIGYYYVSVDPDPYYNFIYRISTSLPKNYWSSDIKHITHPLGWEDFYVLVPTDENNWHQMKSFATMSEFEEYWEKYGNFPDKMYADINYFTDEENTVYRWGRYIGNAMHEEMFETKEFPFKFDDYNASIDYNINSPVTDTVGVFYDVRSTSKDFYILKDYDTDVVQEFQLNGESPLFKYTNTGYYSWTLEFLKDGISAVYIWDIYQRGAKIGSITTHIPKLKYFGKKDEYYDIILRLEYKNFKMPVYNFRISNENIKLINSMRYGINKCYAYIDQRVSSTVDRHDAMLLGDSGTAYKYPIEDGHYDGILDSVLLNSLASSVNINSDNDLHTAFLNDISGTENLIQGIFTEYEWIVSNTATTRVINKYKTTNSSFFCDMTGVTLQVNLIRGDEIFPGPSIDI